MTPFLARLLSPTRAALLREFMWFCTVGLLGFTLDNACVYGLRATIGLYWAGVIAYVTAATANWAANRAWTYRHRQHGAIARQWALFLAVNLVGFTLNRGVYFLLVTFSALAADQPVIAIFAGTLAGMFLNFYFSRSLVFR